MPEGSAMGSAADGDGQRGCRWRIAAWGTAAFLLLLPLIAMQFTDEVDWDETDFIVFGAMLALACGTFELSARMTGDVLYRAAVGVTVMAAFVLVWINLSVGIIGSEDNPANLMYGGVLAVAILGAVIGRFQPNGMAYALSATALAQALAGMITLIAGLGSTATSFPEAIVVLTGLFTVLWLIAAWLFRQAARRTGSAG